MAEATNEQVLEGLWALGMSTDFITGIDTSGSRKNFVDRLQSQYGLTLDQIHNAYRIVETRFNDVDGVMGVLTNMGFPVEQIVETAKGHARRSGVRPPVTSRYGITLPDLYTAVEQLLGPQLATQLRIKTGDQPKTAEWNPFRGDVPSESSTQSIAGRAGGARPYTTGEPLLTRFGGRPPEEAAPPPGGPGAGAPGAGVPAAPPPAATEWQTLSPEDRLARLAATYGWGAAFAEIPEVSRILNRVANGEISVDEADRLFRGSDYYKTTSSQAREWFLLERTEPADAARRRQENLDYIVDLAESAGIQNPDMTRMRYINDVALRLGWTDADVRRALASEVRYDPEEARTGVLGQLKDLAREWLVPLSDQAMTTWAQSIVAGDEDTDTFREYLRTQAKSMFPALGTALEDPNMTTRTYLDPYAQDTANILGVNPADIDWIDPKFMRAFNQIDPKTNQRTVMSRADWVTTLMNDPTYDYDSTAHARQQKQNLTTGLLQMWGFPTTGR